MVRKTQSDAEPSHGASDVTAAGESRRDAVTPQTRQERPAALAAAGQRGQAFAHHSLHAAAPFAAYSRTLTGNVPSVSRAARRSVANSDWGPVQEHQIEYTASGGPSLLIQLDNGNEMQIELHEDSYSVLWSTELSVAGVVSCLTPFLPPSPVEALAVDDSGAVASDDVAGVMRVIRDAPERLTFVRLEYDDRILTWERRALRSLATERRWVAAEVGLAASQFDEEYLASLLRETASPYLASSATKLAGKATKIVTARFSVANLHPRQ